MVQSSMLKANSFIFGRLSYNSKSLAKIYRPIEGVINENSINNFVFTDFLFDNQKTTFCATFFITDFFTITEVHKEHFLSCNNPLCFLYTYYKSIKLIIYLLSLQSIINDLFTIDKPLVAVVAKYHKTSDHYNSCLFLKFRNILTQSSNDADLKYFTIMFSINKNYNYNNRYYLVLYNPINKTFFAKLIITNNIVTKSIIMRNNANLS
ncbi:hypothetical protein QTP88_018022 [Uroleucon formosanum]